LYNLMGQEVLAFKIHDSSQASISIKDLAKGVYTVVVINPQQEKQIRKVVVF
nr:T9SS type A sorting domain-containing protein [Bacteroidota bacterium]